MLEKKRERKRENPETEPNLVSPPKHDAGQPFSSIPFPRSPISCSARSGPTFLPFPQPSAGPFSPLRPTAARAWPSPALRFLPPRPARPAPTLPGQLSAAFPSPRLTSRPSPASDPRSTPHKRSAPLTHLPHLAASSPSPLHCANETRFSRRRSRRALHGAHPQDPRRPPLIGPASLRPLIPSRRLPRACPWSPEARRTAVSTHPRPPPASRRRSTTSAPLRRNQSTANPR